MSHGSHPIPAPYHFHKKTRWLWIFTVIAGLAALVLGIWGIWTTDALNHREKSVLNAVYDTIEMFLLHYEGQPGPMTWQLNLARFLAPLVLSVGTIIAFFSLAVGHQLRLRHILHHDHVVICGLGRKGMQLARRYRELGIWVAAIESDPANPALLECESLGIPFWIGDAGDIRLLEHARVHRAAKVIAITPDDGKNIEIALRVRDLSFRSRSPANAPVRCYMHIVDPQIRSLTQAQHVFDAANLGFTASICDFYADFAKVLFHKHPLAPPGDTQSTARLIIIAFGQMGESVAVQAVQLFAPVLGPRLKLTIIDRELDQLRRQFDRRYPRFDQSCDIEFIPFDFDSAPANERLQQICNEPGSLLTFAVCCDADSRALIVSLELKRMLGARPATILTRMASRHGLSSLLHPPTGADPSKPNQLSGIHPFGMIETLTLPDQTNSANL